MKEGSLTGQDENIYIEWMNGLRKKRKGHWRRLGELVCGIVQEKVDRCSGRIDGGELDYGFTRKERGWLWKNGRMTALELYVD